MASRLGGRRWIVILLIAIGAILIATLPRGATDDDTGDSDTLRPAAEAPDTEGGLARKRVIEGCDPSREAEKYEDLVGGRALAVLRWNNMSERAAKLKIPVYITSVDDGGIGVSILPIPMRTQYLTIWQNSGHIERGEGDTFVLDPCASWLEPWVNGAGEGDDH